MEATTIPLANWQDPQGDVLMIYSEHECSVFFGCWAGSGQPADHICRLSFERAVAVRRFIREFLPYNVSGYSGRSYILRVCLSDWLHEHNEYRRRKYPTSSDQAVEHSHFIVVSHDIYHEILAVDFTETVIPAAELVDERLLALHRATQWHQVA